MKKQTVAIIFGSRSAEHDVSIVTALAAIIKPLELTKKYKIVPIYIAKDGRWFSDAKLKDISFYTSGKIDNYLSKATPIAIQFNGQFTLLKPGIHTSKTKIDIAFPATHGTHGEDGELMAILEMANIPYVGCGVAASALAMDKVSSKLIAEAHGIPTPKFRYFTKYEYEQHDSDYLQQITQSLSFPLFVKPAHLGSSIGIAKVTNKRELEQAIEVALHYDDKALVEEAVPNLIEVTLPIMGNDILWPALLEQPLVSDGDFFDFDTKYLGYGKGGAKKVSPAGGKQGAQGYSKIPADLPKTLYDKAQNTALDMYRAIGCSGIARVDLLIDGKTKRVYFNEVNPLPGSLYAHNWRATGVSGVDLVTKLIGLAEQRHNKRRTQETVFQTNFLKQF